MTPRREAAVALRVGSVVLFTLAVFVAGIWILGSTSRVWSAKNHHLVRFNNAQGLSRGSIVSVAGYTIGTVSDITLPKDVKEGLVEIDLAIERKHAEYIRTDTRARIKTIGLLGDKYIDLSPGSAEVPVLEPGAEIRVVQPPNLDALMEQGESVADNLVVLSANMRKITERWERGEGFIGQLIADTEEGRRLSADIKGSIASVRSLGEKADHGEGLIATLLNDPVPSRNLRSAMSSLARVTRSLESGDGLAARLISDPEFGRETAGHLNAASRELRELATRLNHADGLVHTVFSDPAYAREVTGNIRETSENLASIARRIAEGEGTLGKLLVDETLYRGMNDILAGATRSRLTRWFVSRSQKRGVEERLRRMAPAAPPTPPPASASPPGP